MWFETSVSHIVVKNFLFKVITNLSQTWWCTPGIWKVEAGGSELQGYRPLHSRFEVSMGHMRENLFKKLKASHLLLWQNGKDDKNTYD